MHIAFQRTNTRAEQIIWIPNMLRSFTKHCVLAAGLSIPETLKLYWPELFILEVQNVRSMCRQSYRQRCHKPAHRRCIRTHPSARVLRQFWPRTLQYERDAFAESPTVINVDSDLSYSCKLDKSKKLCDCS
jgi:hypothetical protein